MDSEELLSLFPQLDPERALRSSWPNNPTAVNYKADLLGIFASAIARRGIKQAGNAMTAAQLIEKLSKADPDDEVYFQVVGIGVDAVLKYPDAPGQVEINAKTEFDYGDEYKL